MSQNLTEARKEELIAALTKDLIVLRAKAAKSQEELAESIGLSRQSYSSIECGKRKMTWRTYLALLFFFDTNPQTHDTLRQINVFPVEFDTSSERNTTGYGYESQRERE